METQKNYLNFDGGFYSHYLGQQRPKFLDLINQKITKIQQESFDENSFNQLNSNISLLLKKMKKIITTKKALFYTFVVFLVIAIFFIIYYFLVARHSDDASSRLLYLILIIVFSSITLIFFLTYIIYWQTTKKNYSSLNQELDQKNFEKKNTLKDFFKNFNPYELKKDVIKEMKLLTNLGFPLNQNYSINKTRIKQIDQVNFFKPFLNKYYEFAANSINVSPSNFEFGIFSGLPFFSFGLSYQRLVNVEYVGSTIVTWTETNSKGQRMPRSETVTASVWRPKPTNFVFEQTSFKTNVDKQSSFSLVSSNHKVSKKNNDRIKLENDSFNERYILKSNDKVSALTIFDLLSQEKLVSLKEKLNDENIVLEKFEDNLLIPCNVRISSDEEFLDINNWIQYDLSSWLELSEKIKNIILFKIDIFYRKFSAIFEISIFNREIYLNDGMYQQMDYYQTEANKLREDLFNLMKHQLLDADLNMVAKQHDLLNSGFLEKNYLFKNLCFPTLRLKKRNYVADKNLEILTIKSQAWYETSKIVYVPVYHRRVGRVLVPVTIFEYWPRTFTNDLVITNDKAISNLFSKKISNLFSDLWFYQFESRNQHYFCLNTLKDESYKQIIETL